MINRVTYCCYWNSVTPVLILQALNASPSRDKNYTNNKIKYLYLTHATSYNYKWMSVLTKQVRRVFWKKKPKGVTCFRQAVEIAD